MTILRFVVQNAAGETEYLCPDKLLSEEPISGTVAVAQFALDEQGNEYHIVGPTQEITPCNSGLVAERLAHPSLTEESFL